MDTWHTKDTIDASNWKNHPTGDELDALLVSAKVECIAFAPPLAADAPVPENYALAQLMQAKALYNAQQGPGPDDMFGGGGEAGGVRVYDMGATVRRLLRPMRGLPGIG